MTFSDRLRISQIEKREPQDKKGWMRRVAEILLCSHTELGKRKATHPLEQKARNTESEQKVKAAMERKRISDLVEELLSKSLGKKQGARV